mmetsp:Transcript_59831/g.144175  ORF Transcript_59831/g.144175 Transcript_59831/m.144175 type:complete len:237 (-) Transcript_59831:207-917(-)
MHMVHAHKTSRRRVTERRVVDGPAAELARLRHGEVRPEPSVQNAVGVRRPRPDRKLFALDPRPVAVAIVQVRADTLVPSRDHRPHGEPIALVRIHDVVEQLGGSSNRDALAVPQLVEAAQPPEVPLPVLAIGRATRHRPEKVGCDLNALLHGLRTDVAAHGCARVDGQYNAALENEPQSGGSVEELESGIIHGIALTGERARQEVLRLLIRTSVWADIQHAATGATLRTQEAGGGV